MVVEAIEAQIAKMKNLLLQKIYLQLNSRDIIRAMMMATEQAMAGVNTVFIITTKTIIKQKMVKTPIKGAMMKVMMKVIVREKQR